MLKRLSMICLCLVGFAGLALTVSCSLAALPPVRAVTALDRDQQEPQEIAIWPGIAPGSQGWPQKPGQIDLLGAHVAYNVVRPTLTAFFPAPGKANGAAVIIAPGGGFRGLSIKDEGYDVARWLAAHGVTAFVLKYRTVRMPDSGFAYFGAMRTFIGDLTKLMKNGSDTDLAGRPASADVLVPARIVDWPAYSAADGLRAMKVVRAHATDWGVDSKRVGFMGFSAGAAVTYGVVLGSTPAEMPAFVAPIYYSLAPDVPLPAGLPPIFMGGARDDALSRGIPATAERWKQAGGSATLHMWADGGHGFGMKHQGKASDGWIETYYQWLAAQGFLRR